MVAVSDRVSVDTQLGESLAYTITFANAALYAVGRQLIIKALLDKHSYTNCVYHACNNTCILRVPCMQ